MRKLGRALAIGTLIVTGLLGLSNASTEFGEPTTGWQQSVWFGVALYGALGVLAGVGLARRRPWCVTLSTAWAITVTYVSTVASFAYSDPGFTKEGTVTGVIAACLGSAAIGLLVVWAARVATRTPASPVA
jgi:hypothetical protein